MLEPNDSLSAAYGPLSRGGALQATLCNGDPDDYYFVTLSAAGTLSVDLTGIPAGTDFDLLLYNSSGAAIAESRKPGAQAEQIRRSVQAGRYYVRVHPYSGRSPAAYTLLTNW
jgi:hypothetical protein